ncbi:MAG: ABC transporter substrate-binding protein [Desulfobulbus sp.]|uniref:ABC transporter substrate-binding protein n=1 Tax=Desulfobulbus sp. TaxID=895 RepID=UPI0028410813|nr:ABC transporter substrate-binding protein [Desulfobulbus sp.]MDR2549877.1 ABC transporter substrate-binding protein [Desulfobulbus sp.]
MKRRTMAGLSALVLAVGPAATLFAADGVIKLGVSSSKSGNFANVGTSTKNGAEMAKQEINAGNGLPIGNKTYTVELVYVDNGSDRSSASTNALALISQHQVIAIVGPQSSDRAIPVGEVANSFKTPMVSPWSTSPLTTQNKPFVFRMPVLYDIQATATTKFAAKEWKARKAAVLYDEISPYPSGMAKAFKQAFEKVNGPGSVAVFETFRTNDADFSRQLQAIINSDAEFLYTPQHYEEVPLIVRQARKMGWKKPITGSNSWSGGDLVGKCGDACNGLYFTGNFAAGGAKGKAKVFADNYQKQYKMLPDEVSALTYDAVHLVAEALKKTGGLTGNIVEDRSKLRDQIAATKKFEGVTGTMGYFGTGDPTKCTVLIKIDDNGLLTDHDKICPEN